MTDSLLHPVPPPRAVMREQLRAVGLALRLPALLAGALLAATTLVAVSEILRAGAPVGFHPERWFIPGLAGALLPIAVWNGERRYGDGFLWLLPVDRRAHALAKVGAGWVWLMAAVAVFVLWLLGLTLLSGGSPLRVETLGMISPGAMAPGGAVDPAAVRPTPWRPEPLLWLAPFTAATAAYLLSSALTLGPRHPLRWVAGSVLGFFLLAAVAEASNSRLLLDLPNQLMGPLVSGRWGLGTLLVAGTEGLKVETLSTTGQRMVVWLGLPDPGPWAAATLLWTAAGLLALWAAASRHRERRRG